MDNLDTKKSVKDIPESIKYPFSIIQALGLYFPKNPKSKRVLAIATIYLFFPVFLFAIAIMQFVNIKGDIFEVVNNLEEMASLMQFLGKCTVMVYRQKDFAELLITTKQFWDSSVCDESTQAKLKSVSYAILRLQKFYIPCGLIAILFTLMGPFFGRSLPMGVWNLEGYDVFYRFVLGLQTVTLPCCGLFVTAFDGTFLAFCIETAIQFKILCNKLQNLNACDDRDVYKGKTLLYNMRSYIQQHIFLQEFIRKFRQVYSMALLVEYFTISPIICSELYAMLEGRTMQLKVRHSMAFFGLVMQLSFYCVPANYMVEEAMTLANAVYCSKWYLKYFASSKTPLLLMIQNSQRKVAVTAGGLITFNTTTILNVLKMAWSACTVIRGLK